MAQYLKKEQTKNTIMAIKAEKEQTYDPLEINKHFFDYYSTLYRSEKILVSEAKTCLESLDLSQVTTSDQQTLNKNFSEEEVFSTIKSMPANKSPGPDGFSGEFYKTFWPQLKAVFMPMIHDFFNHNTLPASINTARISVILKEGKDPQKCASYRAISLLNCDYKIITKLLSKRLESVFPKLVKLDQTGFIKGRYSSDNTRRLFNIIHYLNQRKKHPLC